MFQKNELVRSDLDACIYRVLIPGEDRCLMINCDHQAMPEWVYYEELFEYHSGACLVSSSSMDELSPIRKKKAIERYTMISAALSVMGDKRLRTMMINQASEQYKVSKQTLRIYLWQYLVYQDISVLAPKELQEKPLTDDQKNFRWALNATFYNCTSLQTAPTIPENVVDIGYMFYGCSSLKGDVVINASPAQNYYCFYNCAKDAAHKITLHGTSRNMKAILEGTNNNPNIEIHTMSSGDCQTDVTCNVCHATMKGPHKMDTNSICQICNKVLIPEEASYYLYSTMQTLYGGEEFPSVVEDGDRFTYGSYEYRYNCHGIIEISGGVYWEDPNSNQNGWGVAPIDAYNIGSDAILTEICGKPVNNAWEEY